MNRRVFLAAAAGLAQLVDAQTTTVPEPIRNLRPMTGGITPITDDERRARIEKARRLMSENKLGAIFLEGGTSMFYFTGTRWINTARPFGLILPQRGEHIWVLSAADQKQASDSIRLGGDVRIWPEEGDPFRTIAQALKDRGVTSGRLGIEERVRFSTFDGIQKEAPSLELASATPVTAGCRMIKSPAELALMQRAADVTIACYRAALATLHEGMSTTELAANVQAAYRALGFPGSILIGFGKYTAFPHGSIQPQKLKEGDMVLIDDGCTVEGYKSDITRTTVFGKPAARQTQIWNLERKAQDAALAAAKPGATCESVDAAARKVITDFGFGPDYKVPGLPHRTGHGIGLDGHEWTNLVRGNKTRIQPGMCFSDEPMIAIYGEFGIRLEDSMYITESGARTFSAQSPAIDQPFG